MKRSAAAVILTICVTAGCSSTGTGQGLTSRPATPAGSLPRIAGSTTSGGGESGGSSGSGSRPPLAASDEDVSDLCSILTPIRVGALIRNFKIDPNVINNDKPAKSCEYFDASGGGEDPNLGARAGLVVIDPAETERRGGAAKTLAFFEKFLSGPLQAGARRQIVPVDLGDGGTEYRVNAPQRSQTGYTFLWRNGERVIQLNVSANDSARLASADDIEGIADDIDDAF